MEHKLSTRAMTEGALMAGLAAIFAFLSLVPFLGVLAIFISGIPITIATARHGSFTGGLSAILATIIIALFLSPLTALSYGLENMLLGFVLGYMLNKRKNGMKILQAGVITAGLASLTVVVLNFAIMGFTPDSISAYYAQLETEMLEMYTNTGLMDAMTAQEGVSTAQFTAMLQSMIAVIVKLVPALMLLRGAINGAFIYWLTMILLKRLKIRIPRTTAIGSWRLPFSSIWLIIAVWTLWLMGDRIPFQWVNIVTMNAVVVCAMLVFFNGLAAAMHIFNWKEMSTGMKIVTVFAFLMFFTGFILGLIILGLVDLLFDFRKKKADNSKVS